MNTVRSTITAALLFVGIGSIPGDEVSLATLGKRIFTDTSLSEPAGQSCITCHNPKTAFADPRRVSPGVIAGREGHRNAPSLMYSALISPMKLEDTYDENGELNFIVEGGFFYDGRAQSLRDQVREPFFEKNEMNLADEAVLAARLRKSEYSAALKKQLGEEAWQDDKALNGLAFQSLVEFLREPMFRPFNARIDDYWGGDKEALTASEKRGLDVFETKAACSVCHLVGTGTSWLEPLLTDFGYDNLGAPSIGEKDPGLGGYTGVPDELGQFKVPTLRNVTLTAPYLHNGSIATLREVLEFYNKRDLEPERWSKTDYPETVNHEDMGNLELTDHEVDDLLALMDAFTDRNLLEMKPDQTFPTVPEGVPTTEERKAFFPNGIPKIDPATPRK